MYLQVLNHTDHKESELENTYGLKDGRELCEEFWVNAMKDDNGFVLVISITRFDYVVTDYMTQVAVTFYGKWKCVFVTKFLLVVAHVAFYSVTVRMKHFTHRILCNISFHYHSIYVIHYSSIIYALSYCAIYSVHCTVFRRHSVRNHMDRMI